MMDHISHMLVIALEEKEEGSLREKTAAPRMSDQVKETSEVLPLLLNSRRENPKGSARDAKGARGKCKKVI